MKNFLLFIILINSAFAAEKECFDYRQPVQVSFLPKNLSLSVQPTSVNFGNLQFSYDSKESIWTFSDSKKGWSFYDAVKSSWLLIPFGDIRIIAAEKGSAALVLDSVQNIRGTFAYFKQALLRDVKAKPVMPFSGLAKKSQVKILEEVTLSNDPYEGFPGREWKMGQLAVNAASGERLLVQSATLFHDRGNSFGMGAERLPISGYQIVSLLNKDSQLLGSIRMMRMNQKWIVELKDVATSIELKDSKTFLAVDCSTPLELGRALDSIKAKKKN